MNVFAVVVVIVVVDVEEHIFLRKQNKFLGSLVLQVFFRRIQDLQLHLAEKDGLQQFG